MDLLLPSPQRRAKVAHHTAHQFWGGPVAGSIRQRGATSWELAVYIGFDREAGKRRYAKKTVKGTRRGAERELARFVIEVSDGGRVATDRISFGDVLDRWLTSRAGHLSASTLDRYRVAITHVTDDLKRMPVDRLRAHHIEDLYADLVARGQSGSSIRKLQWAMRQALAWAYKRGLVGAVVARDVELPPLNARKVDPPSSIDVRTVVENLLARDPDWGTMVAFIAWTGCRRGEAAGLRWDDVDLKGASVLIARSVAAVPGGSEVKGTKTGDRRRIAIGPRMVTLLDEHRQRCTQFARDCGAQLEPSTYVFSPEPDGSCPYNPHTITRVFVDACKTAGVPKMRLHDLRHHSATTLLKQGVPVGEVMDRHGWRTVEMVNRYRHLLEATDVGAAIALENA
jgi:integrase